MAERHCKCLICKDGVVRGYSSNYNHLVDVHDLGPHGKAGKIELGITHENTAEPTTLSKKYTKRQKAESPVVSSATIDIPCVLRVNTLTGERVVILGGSE
jgi:hypothetical protein